jgi:YVTN family beta-propeller protein
VGEEPEGVALLNDGTKLYVTNSESNTVSVFEVLSASPYLGLLKTVSVGMEPSGVAVTRPESFVDGDFVYVTNRDDNTVSVIDATNDTVIATIPVGKGPKGVTTGIIPTQ